MAGHNYDIFISYRRDGGYDTAKHLYDLLARDGYRVSFDIDTLRNGNFDETLLNRIDQCKDFILIVDKNAFDRTLDSSFDPNYDWLRQELAYALKKDKNIIPIFLNGRSGFPSGLPEDISGVTKKNGPEYNRYYFNDFYSKLKKEFLISKRSVRLYRLIIILFIILLCVIIIYSFFGSNSNLNLISGDKIINNPMNIDTVVAGRLRDVGWTDDYSEVVCNVKLTDSDVAGLSKSQIRILRNTIYARHGRKFKSADLRDYFSGFSWYHGVYDEISPNSLSDIERHNIVLLQKYE